MEASEAVKDEALTVEGGDIISYQCTEACCENSDSPTKGDFLVLEVEKDDMITISRTDQLTPLRGKTRMENGYLIVEIGPVLKRFKIMDVAKGAGSELLGQYERYGQLIKKHTEADISEEAYAEIQNDFDRGIEADLFELILSDRDITSKYVQMSAIFDLLGIRADTQQIAMASRIMSHYERQLAMMSLQSSILGPLGSGGIGVMVMGSDDPMAAGSGMPNMPFMQGSDGPGLDD